MALPVHPNLISLGMIRDEFGGAAGPIHISNYYSGGPNVPGGTVGYPLGVSTVIPAGGQISLGNFHGAQKAQLFVFTDTQLWYSGGFSQGELFAVGGGGYGGSSIGSSIEGGGGGGAGGVLHLGSISYPNAAMINVIVGGRGSGATSYRRNMDIHGDPVGVSFFFIDGTGYPDIRRIPYGGGVGVSGTVHIDTITKRVIEHDDIVGGNTTYYAFGEAYGTATFTTSAGNAFSGAFRVSGPERSGISSFSVRNQANTDMNWYYVGSTLGATVTSETPATSLDLYNPPSKSNFDFHWGYADEYDYTGSWIPEYPIPTYTPVGINSTFTTGSNGPVSFPATLAYGGDTFFHTYRAVGGGAGGGGSGGSGGGAYTKYAGMGIPGFGTPGQGNMGMFGMENAFSGGGGGYAIGGIVSAQGGGGIDINVGGYQFSGAGGGGGGIGGGATHGGGVAGMGSFMMGWPGTDTTGGGGGGGGSNGGIGNRGGSGIIILLAS